MKQNKKTWLVAAACLVLCVALVVLIVGKFARPPVVDEPLPSVTPSASTVTVPPISPVPTPSPIPSEGPPEPTPTSTAQDVDVPEPSEVQQQIQSTPSIPPDPDPSQLTDPAVKPDGTKVEGTPDPVDHDAVPTPSSVPPASSTVTTPPSDGADHTGQIFVPGFGWIEDDGKENEIIYIDDMYENGNKIGY